MAIDISPYPISPLTCEGMERAQILAADTETYPIGPKSVIPDPVCLVASLGDDTTLANAVRPDDAENWRSTASLVCDPPEGLVSLWCNAAFDLNVLARHQPHLIPAIFKAYREGRIQCVKVREKLLNLADTGSLEFRRMPDGSNIQTKYSLNELEKCYLGLDRKEEKTSEDSWRTRFQELAAMPFDLWPLEALDYVVQDVHSLPTIWQGQERRRQSIIKAKGIDPWGANGDLAVLRHRCTLDFVLYYVGAQGMTPDPERIQQVKKGLEEKLTPQSLDLLIKEGILRPAQPPQPYANGAKDKDGNLKMKAAVEESINKNRLAEYIEALAKTNKAIEVKYSPKTGKVSCDKEWLDDHAEFDPVLGQYQHRQSLQKLVSTELPRMLWAGEDGVLAVADRVYSNYDQPKETGRTSSFAGSLYPSFNVQNVHKDIRDCFVAEPGTALVSSDYEGMELGTLAQVCYQEYGFSQHQRLINDQINIHTFLGAQLAYFLDDDFRQSCESLGLRERMDVYKAFKELEYCDVQELSKFFKRFRTFAKPTDLGYPGGLREKTFLVYAKATYKVDLVAMEGSYEAALALAKRLREIYLDIFPEMPLYFQDWEGDKWRDWSGGGTKTVKDKETGEERTIKTYCYTTPMGMHRANCSYNAAANGKGLQSPSAEGATMGLVDAVEECINPALDSVLFGRVNIKAFIHDELLYSVAWDDTPETAKMSRACVQRIEQVMTTAMRRITPDVESRVESAMMLRWTKDAKPVHRDGVLVPWKPKETK